MSRVRNCSLSLLFAMAPVQSSESERGANGGPPTSRRHSRASKKKKRKKKKSLLEANKKKSHARISRERRANVASVETRTAFNAINEEKKSRARMSRLWNFSLSLFLRSCVLHLAVLCHLWSRNRTPARGVPARVAGRHAHRRGRLSLSAHGATARRAALQRGRLSHCAHQETEHDLLPAQQDGQGLVLIFL